MKSHIILSSILISLALLLTSCFEDGICVTADGNIVSETVDPGQFTGVKLTIDGTVNLIPGDSLSIVASGSENILDRVEYDISGEMLKIDLPGCTRNTDLVFDITMPALTAVAISGSGKIIGVDKFDIGSLSAEISGSGDIELELDAEHIETKISGSGDITFMGSAESLTSRISGSGDIHAFDMSVNRADLTISGSGNIEVTVVDDLTAKISGSGDIRYKGTPTVSVEISGSGSLEDAN